MFKKIILFQGGVETLDYFSRQMGDEFKRQGINVFYFNLEEAQESVKKVKKFIKSGETAMLTFNFEGLEREEYIYIPERGYIWNGYNMPVYNIAVDHPYYYHNRFMNLMEDETVSPGFIKNYHHISIDRNHQKYMRNYYPEFDEAGFLPLAGTNALPQEDLLPIKDRKTDIIFTGNYTELSFFDKHIHAINEEYAAFYMGIINDIISHPDKTIEEVEIAHCIKEMGPQPDEDMRLAMHRMIFVDLYVRNYFRGEAIRTLSDSGFPVTVIGDGWEKLPVKKPNRLTILPQTDSLECLMAIRNSKVSLNVMPWFKDGTHDRVMNSILNGAICCTDDSVYQREILKDGEGVCYYNLSKMDTLCDKMNDLLSDQVKLQERIEQGLKIVSQDHTWANRARCFMEIVAKENKIIGH